MEPTDRVDREVETVVGNKFLKTFDDLFQVSRLKYGFRMSK